MWKRISTKTLFSHPRLNLSEDNIELPDGSKISYLMFSDHPDGVCVIAKNAGGKLLVLDEYFYPSDSMQIHFVTGAIETGETPLDAAQRELGEEGGMHAHKLTKLGVFDFEPRRTAALMHVFLAEQLTDDLLVGDPEEHIETDWMDPREIQDLIADGKIINRFALATWAIYQAKIGGSAAS